MSRYQLCYFSKKNYLLKLLDSVKAYHDILCTKIDNFCKIIQNDNTKLPKPELKVDLLKLSLPNSERIKEIELRKNLTTFSLGLQFIKKYPELGGLMELIQSPMIAILEKGITQEEIMEESIVYLCNNFKDFLTKAPHYDLQLNLLIADASNKISDEEISL